MKRCECGHSHVVCGECGGLVPVEKPRAKKAPRSAGRMKPTREQLRERTAEIRAYVDRRDPYCVICRLPAPEPWEMHHADSGTGKTQRQTKRNCFKTHEECHDKAHAGDLDALVALRNYARDLGYGETETVLQHRINKVWEARAQPEARKAAAR